MDSQPFPTLADSALQEGHQVMTAAQDEHSDRRISTTHLQQFYDYDFHYDQEFLNGWQKIPNQGNPENYLKAKVFYYSRKFGIPLSKDVYKQWLNENDLIDKGPPKGVHMDQSCQEPHMNKHSDDASGEQSKEDNSALPDSDSKKDNSALSASDSISFGDVIDHIERGLTLPGIKDLNIEAINTEPKASEMTRKKKPWESDG